MRQAEIYENATPAHIMHERKRLSVTLPDNHLCTRLPRPHLRRCSRAEMVPLNWAHC
jgi:hypothetical protein